MTIFTRVLGAAAIAAAALGILLIVPKEAQAGKPCYTDSDCPKGQNCYWTPFEPFGHCRKSNKV